LQFIATDLAKKGLSVRKLSENEYEILYKGTSIFAGKDSEVAGFLKKYFWKSLDKTTRELEEIYLFKKLGELKEPARAILKGEDIPFSNKLVRKFAEQKFKKIKLGKYGEAEYKYIWTIDNNGINIGLEQTKIGENNVIKHSNLSPKAYSGGEVWFIKQNEIHINAWSGRFGAGNNMTKEVWELSIEFWKSLGYKVMVEPYK